MVKLASDKVDKASSINSYVVDELLSATGDYRKRKRNSLDYRIPPGSRSNLVLPPKMDPPPQRQRPQEATAASRRGTGIPPPEISREYEEKMREIEEEREAERDRQRQKKKSSRGSRSNLSIHDQLLDDLKRDGVPVFQWVLLFFLLLVGVYQLRSVLATPSAKDAQSRSRRQKGNKRASETTTSLDFDASAIDLLAEGEPNRSRQPKKTGKHKKKSATKKGKASQKETHTPKGASSPISTHDETVSVPKKESTETPSNQAKGHEEPISLSDPSYTQDEAMALELHRKEMSQAANGAATLPEEDGWKEVSKSKKSTSQDDKILKNAKKTTRDDGKEAPSPSKRNVGGLSARDGNATARQENYSKRTDENGKGTDNFDSDAELAQQLHRNELSHVASAAIPGASEQEDVWTQVSAKKTRNGKK